MQSCRPVCHFLFVLSVSLASAFSSQRLFAQAGAEVLRAEEQRIERSLGEVAEWDFVDTPLSQVIESVGKRLNCNAVLDEPALNDFGIGLDTPITSRLKGITYRSCLNLVLSQIELSWRVENGLLFISTTEGMGGSLIARAFPAGELVRNSPGSDELYDYSSLVAAIKNTIQPDSWDGVGGPGSIQGIYGALVVSQTREVLDQIAQLLEGCRTVLEQLERDPEAVPQARGLFEANVSRICDRLAKPTTVDFRDVELSETLGYFSAMHDIPLVIDTAALEDFGIGRDTPITFRLRGLPLSNTLNLMLKPLNLTYVLRDEVMVITTTEEAEAQLRVRIYPVNDLVEAVGQDADVTGQLRDFDSLARAIQSTVQPDSWDVIGGPASLAALQTPIALVIAQTERGHVEIANLLAEVRRAKEQEQTRVNQ